MGLFRCFYAIDHHKLNKAGVAGDCTCNSMLSRIANIRVNIRYKSFEKFETAISFSAFHKSLSEFSDSQPL